MKSNPSRILIIKPGAIGDLLHISPTVRAINKRFPDAKIDMMVSSQWTTCLFDSNPHINRVLYFDRKGEHKSWSRFKELLLEVRRSGYDLVINFQRSTFKVWLLVLAAAPCRVLVYHKAKKRRIHAVINHLETVVPLGIETNNEPIDLEMFISRDDDLSADQLLTEANLGTRKIVALNLGASNRIKCWAPDSFALLADRLYEEAGVAVALVGGKDELDLADTIMQSCTNSPVNFVNRLSLGELGGVLQRCAVLVSGDTGPLHLSTAVGTPVIALFGAIDPDRTGPVGKGNTVISHPELSCVPCNGKDCQHTPYRECMTLISVDEVMAAVCKYL